MRTFETNRVVRHTGSKYPIFQAPIGGMSRGQWAGGVSAAGGMGLVATITGTFFAGVETLEKDKEYIRNLTSNPFGYHLLPDAMAQDEEMEAEILGWIETNDVPFVAIGYSGYRRPNTKDKWRFIKRLKDAGKVCYFVVDSVEEAVRSEDAGVDGLIVNGADAGGARHTQGLHMFALLQQVRRRTDLPLVAAGGIADGIGMAGAVALGAEGILMGTRFMASNECPIHLNVKNELAGAEQIYHLEVGIPDALMLVVANDYSEKYRRGEIERNGNPYGGNALACFFEGRTDLAMVGGGESAVLFDTVKSAAEIVDDTIAGFWKEIERLASVGLPHASWRSRRDVSAPTKSVEKVPPQPKQAVPTPKLDVPTPRREESRPSPSLEARSSNVVYGSLAGSWITKMNSITGAPVEGELELQNVDGAFSGTMSGLGSTSELSDIRVNGSKIAWICDVKTPAPMKLEFEGQMSEPNKLTGKVKAGMLGSMNWSAQRKIA